MPPTHTTWHFPYSIVQFILGNRCTSWYATHVIYVADQRDLSSQHSTHPLHPLFFLVLTSFSFSSSLSTLPSPFPSSTVTFSAFAFIITFTYYFFFFLVFLYPQYIYEISRYSYFIKYSKPFCKINPTYIWSVLFNLRQAWYTQANTLQLFILTIYILQSCFDFCFTNLYFNIFELFSASHFLFFFYRRWLKKWIDLACW